MRHTFLSLALVLTAPLSLSADESTQWFSWRGPMQDGNSVERFTELELDETPAWVYPTKGASAPVIVDGRVFAIGFTGETTDLVEWLSCLDAETGEEIWKHEFNDFISDTVYNRYAIASPTIDPETRNVYVCLANGLLSCFGFDGELKWQISMMERYGRLTFPNSRAGAPVIVGDLVVARGILAYWGANGPARDRMVAFDKHTGENVYISTPGVSPLDSSFSTPILEKRHGKLVYYVGLGCGNLAAVNALDGAPLWRFQMSTGGINASPVIYKDMVISVHGTENLDSTEEGRMVAIRIPDNYDAGEELVLGAESEVWRNGICMFTSSPVLVGDRVYQITKTGTLACVNADTGEILWEEKLATSNLHSSPLAVGELLLVPMQEGVLHVIRPSDEGVEILQSIPLEGSCLGSPSLANGRVYLHTQKQLYCFKVKHVGMERVGLPELEWPEAGEAVALRPVPNDVLLLPGGEQGFRLEKIDAMGVVVGEEDPATASFERFVPPTAVVRAEMDAEVEGGVMRAGADAAASAGAWKVEAGGLSGLVRGRVLSSFPYEEDFSGYELTEEGRGRQFAYPPLSWIGARFKFEVQERDGEKVLAKTLDNILFQRATAFIGDPELSSYTLQADVMTEGNRRVKSDIGLVNQRYNIILQGNWDQIEISSNHERLKEATPFPITPRTWYTLKTRVDSHEDGSGTILVKCWPRGEDEPEAWTFELDVPVVHPRGAPGIYSLTPQSQQPAFVDNIKLYPSE